MAAEMVDTDWISHDCPSCGFWMVHEEQPARDTEDGLCFSGTCPKCGSSQTLWADRDKAGQPRDTVICPS